MKGIRFFSQFMGLGVFVTLQRKSSVLRLMSKTKALAAAFVVYL